MIDPRAVIALRRTLYARSFVDFARWAWPLVTGLSFPVNPATTAMCAALQSVADGRVWRLLIAIPPGCGKSTLLVCYSAWRFARRADWRSMYAMFASTDAGRESLRVRRLVQHDEFRTLFPAVVLRDDEATIGAWATTKDGRRYALGTDTAITSKRVHELVIDDPMTAADRHSKAARDRVWVWLEESAKSRLDGDRAPIVIVAQRLDRDDLIGRCLESGENWAYLALPAEADGDACELLDHAGALVWRDERREGELLSPQMLSREKLDGLRANASVYATQYQRKPSDDETAVVKRPWWRFHHGPHVLPTAPRPFGCDTTVPAVPTPKRFDRVTIACDLTFGSTKGDYVAIQAWGASDSARFLLARFRRRCGLLESVKAIQEMRAQFPGAKVIVEKAANGAGAIEELKAAGVHGVIGVKPLGGKAERIGLVSATIEAGDCFLPLGVPGLADFVEELAGGTRHDDEQDCAAYAIHDLNRAELRAPYNWCGEGGGVDWIGGPIADAPRVAGPVFCEAGDANGSYRAAAPHNDLTPAQRAARDRGYAAVRATPPGDGLTDEQRELVAEAMAEL